MRTEVKVGLIAGVVVIGAAVVLLFNKGGGTGQPADHIPWSANPDQANSNGAVAARDTTRGLHRTQTAYPGRFAEKPELIRRTLPPSPARTAQRTSPAARPWPPVSEQRKPLPPVVTTRTVVTPPPEPRIAAERQAQQRETGSPPIAAVPPRVVQAPGSQAAEPPQSTAADSHVMAEHPLRVGPLPQATPLSPSPRRVAAPTTAAQPESAAAPVAAPGVAVPPRPAQAMRVDEPAMRLRDARPKPEPVRYTVEESDTLTYIARQKYGDGKYWTKIRDANPGIDPDHLLVGQVLILPSKEEVTGVKRAAADEGRVATAARSDVKSTPAARTYVVATGDSLITIARNVLGDGSRWREIYNLNRDKIKDPDILLEGVELKLPANGPKAHTSSAANGAKKPALRKARP